MKRPWILISYCLLSGGSGWLWLLFLPSPPTSLPIIVLFSLIALLIDILGFRTPPGDPHSLVGIILLTAALTLSPATGALIAALEGLAFGMLLPFIYGRPRTFYSLVARPILRSGTRTLGILGGATLAGWLMVEQQTDLGALILLLYMIAGYSTTLLLGRAGREYLQGGWPAVQTWWRASWRLNLSAEIAPLPLALLGAAVYNQLGVGYFILTSVAMIISSASLRHTAHNVQTQRRSLHELALLNEISRAIIRSELDIDALCELIYREASKVVDTASFHLGLFDGSNFTLMIRVQDRVRLPPLTVSLEPDAGIIGWMRQTGRALLVEDFALEMAQLPAHPRYQSDRPPRSGIYVPLISGETVIGSISIQSYRPRTFTTNDLRLLSLIADQSAVAVTRARTFHETRQRVNQLQAIHEISEHITAILDLDQLLPTVVRRIHERFGYHPVYIFTIEPGQDEITFRAVTTREDEPALVPRTELRIGQGLVGSAAASGQPVLVGDVRADPRYIDDHSTTRSELAVPLHIGDQIIGVLDIQSAELDDFDADDLFVMRTLADQIAIAIDSANSYTAQQEEAWVLNALLQIAENIGRTSTIEELLPTMVRLPPLLVGCDRCYCLLWSPECTGFILQDAYGLSRAQRSELIGRCLLPDKTPLLARLCTELQPLHINAAQTRSTDCPDIISTTGSGTLDVLPLMARASLIGALILDYTQPDRPLNPRHQALYRGAIGQMAHALESVLLSREAAATAYLEQELRVAREIQTTLLPATLPQLPGWQLAADWRSARLVGGDFYDFWWLTNKNTLREPTNTEQAEPSPSTHPSARLGFVIADVSDKGVPAAMFMALARSLVRAAALDGSSPARALERANRWIARDSESGMFVTIFYAILDTVSGQMHYTCAGHNPPLIYQSATRNLVELTTPGIALGAIEEVQLQEATVTMEPDDLLICYTDGLTEAINAGGEPFGVSRLRDMIVTHHDLHAQALLNHMIDSLHAFTDGQAPFDDVTLVIVRRTAADLPHSSGYTMSGTEGISGGIVSSPFRLRQM